MLNRCSTLEAKSEAGERNDRAHEVELEFPPSPPLWDPYPYAAAGDRLPAAKLELRRSGRTRLCSMPLVILVEAVEPSPSDICCDQGPVRGKSPIPSTNTARP
jgi:hypothetical protein